ncbi:hypothetical protein GCM10012275_52830 [Longimycelium tulufanense]|uniref:Uncharacterized protein n=1 Tax=Longimycelium tulufanense TaxID=907463 RepID=A0A8J3CJD8_9PSEU|nr:hypothetical protein [Longimycelium tulufanense]GGM75566.1 hypothetical protein GCM10012275_52830 [Longimycelium tulufanense]
MSDSDAGTGVPETGQEPQQDAPPASNNGGSPASSTDNGWNAAPWRALAEEVGLTPEEIRTKLGHARKWETRAKENRQAAEQLPTVQQQLDDLRNALSERDLRDVERSQRLALAALHTQLAEAGLRKDDVAPLLEHVDALRLLKGGDPDEQAIAALATSLTKVAGRPTPDPDQGAKGETPTDMNALIRRAAGRQ